MSILWGDFREWVTGRGLLLPKLLIYLGIVMAALANGWLPLLGYNLGTSGRAWVLCTAISAAFMSVVIFCVYLAATQNDSTISNPNVVRESEETCITLVLLVGAALVYGIWGNSQSWEVFEYMVILSGVDLVFLFARLSSC